MDMMKYINMSKKEELRFMSECINGKITYSDSDIAFGMALLADQLRYHVECIDTGYINTGKELSLEEAISMVKQLNHHSKLKWRYVEIQIVA